MTTLPPIQPGLCGFCGGDVLDYVSIDRREFKRCDKCGLDSPPFDEVELTMAAVEAFLRNPPEDPLERDRQRMNLAVQVQALRNRTDRSAS